MTKTVLRYIKAMAYTFLAASVLPACSESSPDFRDVAAARNEEAARATNQIQKHLAYLDSIEEDRLKKASMLMETMESTLAAAENDEDLDEYDALELEFDEIMRDVTADESKTEKLIATFIEKSADVNGILFAISDLCGRSRKDLGPPDLIEESSDKQRFQELFETKRREYVLLINQDANQFDCNRDLEVLDVSSLDP